MATIGTLVVALVADSARFEAGMVRARRRSDELERAMRQLEKSGLDRVAAGMSASAAQTQKVSDWMRRLGDASSKTTTAVETTGKAADHAASAGFRKAENAIVDLGLRMVGLEGKTAKVAEGFLAMGVGGTVTLAVTAGLAVIGGAVYKLTEQQRKAREGYEDWVKSMTQQTPLAAIGAQIDELTAKVAAPDFGGYRWLTDFFGLTKTRTQEILQLSEAVKQYAQILQSFATQRHESLFAAGMNNEPGSRGSNSIFNLNYLDTVQRAMGDLQRRVMWFQHPADSNTVFQDLTRQGASAAEEVANVTAALDREGRRLSAALVGVGGGQEGVNAVTEAAKERQKAMAAFVTATWISAAQNIQSNIATIFDGIFGGQLQSLQDFARSTVAIVRWAIAQILAAQVAAKIGPAIFKAFGGLPTGGGDTADASAAGATGSLRANARATTVVQYITYAPTVHAIDAQGVEQFYRRTRGAMIAELARASQDSSRLAPVGR